jgi:type I restriction enzyme, S subunit
MSTWETISAYELEQIGALRVEDGNHGEYRPRPAEFVSEGVAFIRAADINNGSVDFAGAGKINEVARERIRKGVGQPRDVLLSHKGTVGKVALAPDDSPDYVCSPQTTLWRSLDDGRIDHRYLRFSLESPNFIAQLETRKGQSDMAPYVSLTEQRRLSLVLPPIGEQRAIAEVLGALGDKIAANAKLNQATAQLSVALVAERTPCVPLSGIVHHIRTSLAPDRFGDAPLAHFSFPAFDAGQVPETTSPDAIKSSKFLIEQPCVLVSKLNPRFPRIWNVSAVPSELALASTEFLVLEGVSTSSSVLHAILSHPTFSASLKSMVAGTSGSHQRVRPDELLSTLVIDPREIGKDTQRLLTDLGALAADTRRESAMLANLRDALLPQLMSGNIRVKDVEMAVGEVL